LLFYDASIRIDGKYESLTDQDNDLESETYLWENDIGEKDTYKSENSDYHGESRLPSWCYEQREKP
jgi:hypothetical protein